MKINRGILRRWLRRDEEKRLIVAVGEGLVKGLLVERVDGVWVPRKLEVAPLTAGATALPEEWLAAFPKGPGKTKTWVILPRQAMSVQILELPSSKPAEIAEMLQLQLGKLTSYTPEEVMHAHLVLEVTPEGYSRVLLLLARREVIAEAVNRLTLAGFEVVQVIMSSEGIARWVEHCAAVESVLAQGSRVAVLDLDTAFSDFLVVSRGRLEYTRAIPIGLARLAESPLPGEDPEPVVDKLIRELQLSFACYQGEEGTKGKGPVSLVLLGPAACTAPLAERLSTLEIPVQEVDPAADLSIPVSFPGSVRTSLAAVLGGGRTADPPLAGFVPEELMLRRTLQARSVEVAKLGMILVGLLAVLSFIFVERIVVRTQLLNRLDQQVSALTPAATEVEKARMRIRLSQQRLGREASVLRLLDRLYRSVPEDIVLTEVHFETGKEFAIKGYSANMSRIFEFVTALQRLPVFGRVKTKSVAKRKSGDKEVADFHLSCEIVARSAPEGKAPP